MTVRLALRRLTFAGAVVLAAGCGSFGRSTVAPDRSGYSDAIATSWKEQMLLNLVKLKYSDVPVFLDVNSVIASYTFEGRANAGIGWDTLYQRSETVAVGGTYSDRPTITYVPLTGEKFTKALLTPISPATVFSMVQAGWPVAGLFGIAVRSVNGVRNRSLGLNPETADPEWAGLVASWSAVQASGSVDLRIKRSESGETVMIVIGEPKDEAVVREAKRIREVLGIPPGTREFSLSFGTLSSKPGEVVLLTRSLFEIFLEIAATVEVPDEDVAAGRVLPLKEPGAEPIVAIHSSASRPSGAAVMTQYRGRWYWVADDDIRSKTRMMILFFINALLESGSKPNATPALTISN